MSASRVVLDASALAAITFQEPGGDAIAARLAGATVFAPALLKFELANVAAVKARRHPELAGKLFVALAAALDEDTGVIWEDVNAPDVAMLAHALQITAYDAAYLWLAGSLGADLVTLDRGLVTASEAVS